MALNINHNIFNVPICFFAANFGFVYNAERLNSRACMIGFFALIAVEAIIHKGLLEAVGLTVGQGTITIILHFQISICL